MWQRLSRANLAAPLICIVTVVMNQSVFRFGSMPIYWALLFIIAIAIVAVTAPHVPIGAAPTARLQWWNILIGGTIVSPLLMAFALGWDRDFPFSGDSYFHVGQAYRLAYWWLSPMGSAVVRVPSLEDVRALLHHPGGLVLSRVAVLLVLAITTAVVYRWNRLLALTMATGATVVWGLGEQTIFLRYPAGGYFAAMPFLGPSFLLHNVELAGRLAGIAAPIIWLFGLRPWLIGRWPDLRVLPFALLLFWQNEVIYFFNSVYLEPWSIVFCLLVVELLIARGARGAPQACLLIGVAAAIKEPAILALPLVWLAGAPWRKSWRDASTLTGSGFAAGMTFLFYYAARNDLAADNIETTRDFQFALPTDRLAFYAEEFVHRLQSSFTAAGGWLFMVALVALLVMIWRFEARRLQVACIAAAGLILVLFFLMDRQSLAWIGSFRFFLAALPFLAAGALALGYTLRRNAVLVVGAIALVLQAPGAFKAIGAAAGPITGLNFIEHYDAAIFFPMKSLLAEARTKGLLTAGATVLANAPDPTMREIPGIPVTYGPPGTLYCKCTKEQPAVMGLFVRLTNLNGHVVDDPSPSGSSGERPGRELLWVQGRAERPACLAELRRSCGHVLRRVEGGDLVAVLGTLR